MQYLDILHSLRLEQLEIVVHCRLRVHELVALLYRGNRGYLDLIICSLGITGDNGHWVRKVETRQQSDQPTRGNATANDNQSNGYKGTSESPEKHKQTRMDAYTVVPRKYCTLSAPQGGNVFCSCISFSTFFADKADTKRPKDVLDASGAHTCGFFLSLEQSFDATVPVFQQSLKVSPVASDVGVVLEEVAEDDRILNKLCKQR